MHINVTCYVTVLGKMITLKVFHGANAYFVLLLQSYASYDFYYLALKLQDFYKSSRRYGYGRPLWFPS